MFRSHSSPGASVSHQLVHAVLDAAVAAGVAKRTMAAALRTRLETGMDVAAGRMQRLPERTLLAVWEAIVGLGRGDHGVGALLALHADDRAFGVVGEALRQSPTLLGAYEHIARYARLVHQGVTITIDTSSRSISVNYALAGTGCEPVTGARAAGMLWAIGNIALVPRRSFGATLTPRAAYFSCPSPAGSSHMREVFGPNISFGAPTSRLVFARREVADVRRPAEAGVLAYLNALAERDLGDLPPVHDIVAVVTVELRRGLIGGAVSIETVARALGLSSRTLQRRIAEAGSSFADVLDEVRKARARELIAEGGRAMGEIAYMLGYSELAAFSRASRRWFGVAPSKIKDL